MEIITRTSTRQLLEVCSRMYSMGLEPKFYDIKIKVYHANTETIIYASKANLIALNVISAEADPREFFIINGTHPSVVELLLKYCYTGVINELDSGLLIATIIYSKTINFSGFSFLLEEHLRKVILATLLTNTPAYNFKVWVTMKSYQLDPQNITVLIFDQIQKQNPTEIFNGIFYHQPRDIVVEIIKQDYLRLSEIYIFQRIFEWSWVQLSGNLTPKFKPNFLKIISGNAILVPKVCAKFREIFEPLFEYLRFENISMEEVIQVLEPAKIFSKDELWHIIKSGNNNKNSQPFLLFGKHFTSGRKKRE